MTPPELLTPEAVSAEQSLVERYARMANEGLERRPVNPVLRLLDVVLAAAALAVLSPLLGAAALAIRLTSAGPVLYRGLRVGKGGRFFAALKRGKAKKVKAVVKDRAGRTSKKKTIKLR